MNTPDTDDVIIEFRNVQKIFRTYPTPRHRLMQMLTRDKTRYVSETRALDNVSFVIRKGERVGIVGENGSGKSTLLKVLSGVLSPTSGTVTVRGRISALLELGAGFNPELTGMENIRQYCELQGMSADAIARAIPDIETFAELADAIHHPVKTYSSGMSVRLGFSCAVYTDPEILIVDEALSVGDAYFQNKCMNKIKSMLESGITFLYVTHAADSVRNLCKRGLWMDKGRLCMDGSAGEVGGAYQKSVYEKMIGAGSIEITPLADMLTHANPTERHRRFQERVAPLRTGSGEARIVDIEILDRDDSATDTIEFLDPLRIRVTYHITSEVPPENIAVTVGITDQFGTQIVHANSAEAGLYISPAGVGELNALEFELNPPLCPGNYGVMAGLGKFFQNPQQPAQWVLQWVTDACIGGSRISIRNNNLSRQHNLWGLVFAKPDFSTVRIKDGVAYRDVKKTENPRDSADTGSQYTHVSVNPHPSASFDVLVHTSGDEVISREILNTGRWEPFETAVIGHVLKKGDFFLDLGANLGWYTLLASRLIGKEGRVLAFEPDDRNYALLDLNLRINGIDNVERVKAAVSDTESAVNMYRSTSNRGDHRLFVDDNEHREHCVIQTTTLARRFSDADRLPDVVKSDTQGSEARILRGAAPLFAAGWRPIIIAEFWPFGLSRSGDDPFTFWNTLKALGYRILEVAEYNPKLVEADEARVRERLSSDLQPDNWLFTNFLCIPPGCDRIDPLTWQWDDQQTSAET